MARTDQKFPERNAEIIRRRRAGEWPTEIAKAMGVSRNAVIGALNRAGMQSANVDRNAIMKRFALRGDEHASAKLSASIVRAIRREHQPRSTEYGTRALAIRYGVHPQTIHRVLRGETWATA